MLANTVHAYPVLLIGGWIGILASMIVESISIFGYLHRIYSGSWIIKKFILANLLSAVAGLVCFIVLRHPPSGTANDNLLSLVLGVGLAYILTVLIERWVYLRKLQEKDRPPLTRAVVMSNVFSYALLVGIHLRSLT